MNEKGRKGTIGTAAILCVYSGLIGIYTFLSLQINSIGHEIYAPANDVRAYLISLTENASFQNIIISCLAACLLMAYCFAIMGKFLFSGVYTRTGWEPPFCLFSYALSWK